MRAGFLFIFLFVFLTTVAQDTLSICFGESVQLQAEPGFDGYQWTPIGTLNNPQISDPIATPLATTSYVVEKFKAIEGSNLLVNSNFDGFTNGFYSDYIYTPGGTFNQGHFAVLTDPVQFNVGLLPVMITLETVDE